MKKSFNLSILFLALISIFISCKTEFNFTGNVTIVLPGNSNSRSAKDELDDFLKNIYEYKLIITKLPKEDIQDSQPEIYKRITLYPNKACKLTLPLAEYIFDLTAMQNNGEVLKLSLISEDTDEIIGTNVYKIKKGLNKLKFDFFNNVTGITTYAQLKEAVENARPYTFTEIPLTEDINIYDSDLNPYDKTINLPNHSHVIIQKQSNEGGDIYINNDVSFNCLFAQEDKYYPDNPEYESSLTIDSVYIKDFSSSQNLFTLKNNSKLSFNKGSLDKQTKVEEFTFINATKDAIIKLDSTGIQTKFNSSDKISYDIINTKQLTSNSSETGKISIKNLAYACKDSSLTGNENVSLNIKSDSNIIFSGFINITAENYDNYINLYTNSYKGILVNSDIDIKNNKLNLYLDDDLKACNEDSSSNGKKHDTFEIKSIIIDGIEYERFIADNDQVYAVIDENNITNINKPIKYAVFKDQEINLTTPILFPEFPTDSPGIIKELGFYAFKDTTISGAEIFKYPEEWFTNSDTNFTKCKTHFSIIGKNNNTITITGTNTDSYLIQAIRTITLSNVIFEGNSKADIVMKSYPIVNETQLLTLNNCTVRSIKLQREGSTTPQNLIAYDSNTKGPPSQNGKIFITLENYPITSLCLFNSSQNDKTPDQIFDITLPGYKIDSEGKYVYGGLNVFLSSLAQSEITIQPYGQPGSDNSYKTVEILRNKTIKTNCHKYTNSNGAYFQAFTGKVKNGIKLEIDGTDIQGTDEKLRIVTSNSHSPLLDFTPLYITENNSWLTMENLELFNNPFDFFPNMNNFNNYYYFIDNYGTTSLNNVTITPNEYTQYHLFDIIVRNGSSITLNNVRYILKEGYERTNGIKIETGSTVNFKGSCNIPDIKIVKAENSYVSGEPLLKFDNSFTNQVQMKITLDEAAVNELITKHIPFTNKDITSQVFWSYNDFILQRESNGLYYLEPDN